MNAIRRWFPTSRRNSGDFLMKTMGNARISPRNCEKKSAASVRTEAKQATGNFSRVNISNDVSAIKVDYGSVLLVMKPHNSYKTWLTN